MIENIIIRRFKIEDAEELSVLIRRDLKEVNTEDQKWENDYLYEFYTPENVIKNAENGHTYVMEVEGTGELVAIGTIKPQSKARETDENESEICSCFIKPEYLRMHLGTRLFDTLEADEYFVNADRVWLTTSVYAAPFYEHRNYKYTFGYKGKNEENLVEMEKRPKDI
ncbi:MAG: GNAT family N-acetyltransferase [Eubacteriales bacterium]|nr:GNAT family N-acetyltransferase [Eubacteriales bacterium]